MVEDIGKELCFAVKKDVLGKIKANPKLLELDQKVIKGLAS